MIKKLLFTTILTLSLVANQSFATTPASNKTESQIFGLFKFYLNDENKLTITRTERLNTYLTNKDSIKIFGNYSKEYLQLTIPEEKAVYAYQLLLKIAEKADFNASLQEDYHGIPTFGVTIYEKRLHGGLRNQLIPAQDMRAVYPLLIKLLKNQQHPSYLPTQWLYYAQNLTFKMPMDNLNWPTYEYWYDDWYRWVEAELRAICYTSDGERLCNEWGITSRDTNNDGEKDLGRVDLSC